MARLGVSGRRVDWRGEVRPARRGLVCHGLLGHGGADEIWHGADWRGLVWHGRRGLERLGAMRRVEVRLGEARQARLGTDWLGVERPALARRARRGEVRLGRVRCVAVRLARLGKVGRTKAR